MGRRRLVMERTFIYVTSDGSWGSTDDMVVFDPADLPIEAVKLYWNMLDGQDGDELYWFLNTPAN
jgi:hypothetical protein